MLVKGMTNVYSDYQQILSLANDILVRCTNDKLSENLLFCRWPWFQFSSQ